MTLAAARLTFAADGPVLAAEPLPLEALVLGRPVGEVAELLPRLFNLCRAAQALAVRLALGLPVAGLDSTAEIIRDHVLKLCVTLPLAFGQTPVPIPHAASRLLGTGGVPERLRDLARWDSPAADLARYLERVFPAGVAVTSVLPPAPPLAEGAYENSAALRQAEHPLLQEVEARLGRGPLWRYLGLLADLQSALLRNLPGARMVDGVAMVPAARGTYALQIRQAEGRVTALHRRTPTDHLLAPGGALLQALARLPRPQRDLAPAIVALHDPCVPVTLCEAQDA